LPRAIHRTAPTRASLGASVFGAALDLEALRESRIQLVCGDLDLAELKIPARIAEELKPLGGLGRNRVERVGLLFANYRDQGRDARLDFVPGVAHEGVRCVDTDADFLAAVSG
jgi:hypothetical protein